MFQFGSMFLLGAFAAWCTSTQEAEKALETQARGPLRQVETIALGDVEGRIDHLAIDLKRERLFLAALENGTLEVVDLHAKKRLAGVKSLSEPQGVLYLADRDRVVVSNGGSGMLDVFDGGSLERVASLRVGEDADNLRYDASSQHVLVGYGRGAIGIVETEKWTAVGMIRLQGHPEAFALETSASDGKRARVFVNVPGERQIAIVDRITMKTIGVCSVDSAQANYPMTLIEGDERLLVGCRKPGKLVVFDTASGKETGALDLSGDCDDLLFDAARARIYASCGAGSIDVFERVAKGEYKPMAKIATAIGARTCLFVPEQGRLYLAVPHRGKQAAEIRVFTAQEK